MLREIVLKGMKMTFQKRKKQFQISIFIVIGKTSFNLKKSSENKTFTCTVFGVAFTIR